MDSPNVQASGPSSSPCANIPESRIQSMPFMKLPAEIRNSIYRYCFVEDSQTPVNGVNTKFPGIGLLRANKQIHLESSGILYGNNTFTFGLDIDWLNKPEMILHGFPKTLPIWPAPRYHTLLQRLEIQIRFAAGLPTDLEAPEIMQNQIQAMRDAYDSVWDQLDIHFKFMEGDLADLTFTMAWLKFRMLEPISHADCSVETETQVSPVVRWALEATLQQKDLKATLSKEQLKALTESEEIANQVSEASVLDVATRLAHGTVRAPPGPPFTVQGGLSQNPFHQLLNQLASFNSVLNHPLAAFGGPPMVNPSPITPGPFGPSHMMPIMHPYMNGAVPASSLPGPGPWPPSLFGNGPGQSTPAPFANGTPASTLSTSGPVQPISTPYGNGPPTSLFTNGPGHVNPNTFGNGPPPFPLPPPPHAFFPTIPPPPPPARIHRYRAYDFHKHLGTSLTGDQAIDILIRDSEMRVLAAIDLPDESHELSVQNCAVSRIYFKLMEKAGEIEELKRGAEEGV